MSDILMLNQTVMARRRGMIGVFSFQRLHARFFIIGNHQFALSGQFRRTCIKVIDGFTLAVKGFIFGRIEPIAAPMGPNRGIFLKASPHVWVRWSPLYSV